MINLLLGVLLIASAFKKMKLSIFHKLALLIIFIIFRQKYVQIGAIYTEKLRIFAGRGGRRRAPATPGGGRLPWRRRPAAGLRRERPGIGWCGK